MTMTSKARYLLEALSAKEEIVNKGFERLSKESTEIHKEIRELRPQIILEEKLLSTTWEVTEKGYLSNTWHNKDLDALIDLLAPDHHCDFEVAEGVRLTFIDGDMFMCFESKTDMSQFIKDHDITCKLANGIKNKIEELGTQKARLENLLSKFS